MTFWHPGDLELPRHLAITTVLCCVKKPHQLLELPQCCGCITSSQGCCGLSKELNWGRVFKDSGHIHLSSLFSLVLCPFSKNTLRPGFFVQRNGSRGHGVKNRLYPILPMPLLWSEHIMFLGKDLHLGLSCGDVSPRKYLWGGSHASLGTADPGLCPS